MTVKIIFNMKGKPIFIVTIFLCLSSSRLLAQTSPQDAPAYCVQQAKKTLANVHAGTKNLPRSILTGTKEWNYVNERDWCSGF